MLIVVIESKRTLHHINYLLNFKKVNEMGKKYTYETIEIDGIKYINLETVSKLDLKGFSKMPDGHSIYFRDGNIYTKTYATNPDNPPRAAFSMILNSDYKRLRRVERDQLDAAERVGNTKSRSEKKKGN